MSKANDPAPTPDPKTAVTTSAPGAGCIGTGGDAGPRGCQSAGRAESASWLAAHLDKLEVPYVVIVLALAFLVGSFVAYNNDVWINLATGRLIAQGNYEIGVDPFSFSTEATKDRPAIPWINHSWLYSWILYLLYHENELLPVIFKALLGAGVAGLLLFLRPSRTVAWLTLVCAVIATMALSQRLVLQSTVPTYLFFALTLFVLNHAGVLRKPAADTRPQLAVEPAGPVRAVGELRRLVLDRPVDAGGLSSRPYLDERNGRKSPVTIGQLATVLGVSVLACLANPHHVHALTVLPPEVGYMMLKVGDIWPESLIAGGRTLVELTQMEAAQIADRRSDSIWISLTSPFAVDFVSRQERGLNVAGISFFLLILAVLYSFWLLFSTRHAAGGPGVSLLRLVLVVPFALLAFLRARLIPFFAVAGGAVVILNLADYLSWRRTQSTAKQQEQDLWASLSRLGTAFLLFGLCFLAWPGWLNGPIGEFNSFRRVGWNIDVDPSLKIAAETLGDLHEKGKLKRGLNLSPDIASYGAWFAPGTEYFIDQRFQLFAPATKMLSQFDRAVWLEFSTGKRGFNWREVLDREGIDHIVGVGLHQQSRNSLTKVLATASWLNSKDFDAIYADGKTLVAVRKKAGLQFEPIARQWRREAFGPEKGPISPPTLKQLAATEEDPGFWGLYLQGQKRASPETLQAEMLVDYNSIRMNDPIWVQTYLWARLVATMHKPGPMSLHVLYPTVRIQTPKGPYFVHYRGDLGAAGARRSWRCV